MFLNTDIFPLRKLPKGVRVLDFDTYSLNMLLCFTPSSSFWIWLRFLVNSIQIKYKNIPIWKVNECLKP